MNNWDEVPYFLRNPKIIVARSQDHGDVRDNGKFFFVESSPLRYYASVDDDIAYPVDYIEKMLDHQSKVGSGIVAVHATYYPTQIDSLLENRFVSHFKEAFDCLLPATLIGTGTMLLDRRLVDLKYREFGTPGMADVWLAAAAKRRGLSLWVVPRADKWLKPISQSGNQGAQLNLYAEGIKDDSVQLEALKAAGIKGSIPVLLESVVRCPSASVSFGFAEAQFLWQLTRSIKVETLKKRDRFLYSYALAHHKRSSLERCGQSDYLDLVDTYADLLIELVSRDEGHRLRDDWMHEYVMRLDALDTDSAPVWMLGDKSNLSLIETKVFGKRVEAGFDPHRIELGTL